MKICCREREKAGLTMAGSMGWLWWCRVHDGVVGVRCGGGAREIKSCPKIMEVWSWQCDETRDERDQRGCGKREKEDGLYMCCCQE